MLNSQSARDPSLFQFGRVKIDTVSRHLGAPALLTRLTRLNHHRHQHPIDRADMEMHSCHSDALPQFVIHLLLNF